MTILIDKARRSKWSSAELTKSGPNNRYYVELLLDAGAVYDPNMQVLLRVEIKIDGKAWVPWFKCQFAGAPGDVVFPEIAKDGIAERIETRKMFADFPAPPGGMKFRWSIDAAKAENVGIDLIERLLPKSAQQTHSSVTYNDSDISSVGSVSSVSVNINPSTNANRCVFGALTWYHAGSVTFDSMTYNSSAMTASLASLDMASLTDAHLEAQYQTGASSGDNALAVSMSGSTDILRLSGVGMYDVDQTTPVGTPVTSNSTVGTISNDVGTSDDDSLIVDAFTTYPFSANHVFDTVGSGQTLRTNTTLTGSINTGVSTQLGSADSNDGLMTWTQSLSGGGTYQCSVAVEFLVAAAASGRIMSSLAGHGGLAGKGGLAGHGGGLAG